MINHRYAGVLWAVGVGLALVGCSSEASTPAPAPTKDVATAGPAAIARCVTEQGWEIVYNEADNSIQFTGDEQQAQAYDTAYSNCEKEFGEPAVAFDDFSDEMWRDLYSQETKTAICLRAEGVDIPEVPSFETFVQRYPTQDAWRSYGFVTASSASVESELNRLCPQPTL